MSLSPAEQETLECALRDAFRSEPDLRRMVRIRLGPNLNEIVALPANLTNIVADLVTWADANDRIGDLITGAHDSNAGNRLLAAVYADFQAGRFPSAAAPGAGTAAASGTHIDQNVGVNYGQVVGVMYGQAAPPPPPAPPKITVTRLADVFPTAYCRQLDAATFPFVTVVVENTAPGSAPMTLTATAVIEGYSDTAVRTLQVAAGSRQSTQLLPLLRQDAMGNLNEIRRATLRVAVAQTAPAASTLYDQADPIYLQARDVAVLAMRGPDGQITDLTRYLAAWVTPRQPDVERLLRAAVERHSKRQLAGYHGAGDAATGELLVRSQVEACFDALKYDAKVTYVSAPLSRGAEPDQVAQRVRLPAASLQAGTANCVDGSVLFASLLAAAGLEPFLALLPNHMLVGWRVWPGSGRAAFLETMAIGSSSFADALAQGNARWAAAQQRGDDQRGLFDPAGFARLVDVAACQAAGVWPLE